MLDLIESRQIDLRELCLRFGVKTLELFGSAADSTFDPAHSDLDFIVEFLPGQDMGPWLRHYFDFQTALRQLFDREVDVVIVSALKNPHFVRHVNQSRMTLYAA